MYDKEHFHRKWKDAKQRCNNPNNPRYGAYGGRGIKNEWETFYDFEKDMLDSYLEHVTQHGEKNTTIDRIDNGGNYCKENCRWATLDQQNRNKYRVKLYEYKGDKLCIKDLAEKYGINRWTLNNRLVDLGWPVDKAVELPVGTFYWKPGPKPKNSHSQQQSQHFLQQSG